MLIDPLRPGGFLYAPPDLVLKILYSVFCDYVYLGIGRFCFFILQLLAFRHSLLSEKRTPYAETVSFCPSARNLASIIKPLSDFYEI
jgi:hypothetical protein